MGMSVMCLRSDDVEPFVEKPLADIRRWLEGSRRVIMVHDGQGNYLVVFVDSLEYDATVTWRTAKQAVEALDCLGQAVVKSIKRLDNPENRPNKMFLPPYPCYLVEIDRAWLDRVEQVGAGFIRTEKEIVDMAGNDGPTDELKLVAYHLGHNTTDC